MRISPISEILDDFKNGQFVVLIDDENRENEGDLLVAAEFITPQKINFISKEAKGLMYLALSQKQIKRLKLPLMKSDLHSSGQHHAAFTYSIEAASGVGSGISVADRAHTIQVAINEFSEPKDLVCPGHVFPIMAQDSGVLERPGHTEAAVDLSRLCGLKHATVGSEILDEEGSCASKTYLSYFSEKFKIKIGTIADLIEYRKNKKSAHE